LRINDKRKELISMINKILLLFLAPFLPGLSCLLMVFSIQEDGKWQKTSNVHRLSQFPKIHTDGRYTSIHKKVKLIFQSCGSWENPERVISNVDQLKDHGINVVSYVSPDTAHDWMTYRRCFYQFVPLVFK